MSQNQNASPLQIKELENDLENQNKYNIIDIEPSTPGMKLDIAQPSDYQHQDLRMPTKELKYKDIDESKVLKKEVSF